MGPTKTAKPLLPQEEIDEFMSVFPTVVEDLTNNAEYGNIPEFNDHIRKLLRYITPNGKKNRSMMCIASYKVLEKENNLTPKNMRQAYLCAWLIEIFVSFAEMLDDIVDQSESRRGLPCWHTLDNRNVESINDAIYLEQAGYFLFKKYFSKHKNFLSLLDLSRDMLLKITVGQIMDCMSMKNGQVNWNLFTMENYLKIAMHKTGYNTFAPAVTAAMYLANIKDKNLVHNKELRELLLNMGEFYQVQNDFWDCYGDPAVTGKIGNDIRVGKCSWLAVVALEKANAEQKKLMEEFYGKDNAAAEKVICELYQELELEKCFAQYKEENFKKVCEGIKKVPNKFPHKLLYTIVEKVYMKHVDVLY